jgi:hypothetical protein
MGLTIVELLLAMSVTAIVGLVLATMMFSTCQAISDQDGQRNDIVCQDIVGRRMEEVVKSSQMVLASGSDYLVLWLCDPKNRNNPYRSSLCRIDWDSSTKVLTCYRAPANLSPVLDSSYDLSGTDFGGLTRSMRNLPSFPGTIWATDVTAWSAAPDPQFTQIVTYKFTVNLDGVSQTAVGTTALRSQ